MLLGAVQFSFEIVLFEGDFRTRIPEFAEQYGYRATGRTWPEDRIPADVDAEALDWLVTWFVNGWTVLATPGGVSGPLDDASQAERLSEQLRTRVALADFYDTTDLQVFHLFDRGKLVRRFAHYGGDPPTEEEGTPLCTSSEPEPGFAEGSLFSALDALLGFKNDDLLFFEPKLSLECVEAD